MQKKDQDVGISSIGLCLVFYRGIIVRRRHVNRVDRYPARRISIEYILESSKSSPPRNKRVSHWSRRRVQASRVPGRPWFTRHDPLVPPCGPSVTHAPA